MHIHRPLLSVERVGLRVHILPSTFHQPTTASTCPSTCTHQLHHLNQSNQSDLQDIDASRLRNPLNCRMPSDAVGCHRSDTRPRNPSKSNAAQWKSSDILIFFLLDGGLRGVDGLRWTGHAPTLDLEILRNPIQINGNPQIFLSSFYWMGG